MARPKPGEVVKRELPSLFCNKCRTWYESQERQEMFASVDGVKQAVVVWTCPTCRGEKGVELKVSEALRTEADAAKDERLGPYRKVKRETFAANSSGLTGRAELECGHAATVWTKAPKRDVSRCKKCRPKTEV